MKTMNKKLSKKSGFTLVEMLIVVAIIAILIAIAIPLISATLEKAREAVDQGNWRSAISLGNALYLTSDSTTTPAKANFAKGYLAYFAVNDNKEGYIVTTGDAPDAYGQGTAIGNVKADLTECVLAVWIKNPGSDALADYPIVQAVWVKQSGAKQAGAASSEDGADKMPGNGGDTVMYNPATGYYFDGTTGVGETAIRKS